MNVSLQTIARSSGLHVLIAFAAMGGWAAFANRMHLMPAPLIAGLVQGAISAAITLLLKRTVEALASRFGGVRQLLLPPVIAGGTSLIVLATLHGLAGTPEVLETIALPLAVSTAYAALYSRSLWRPGKA